MEKTDYEFDFLRYDFKKNKSNFRKKSEFQKIEAKSIKESL